MLCLIIGRTCESQHTRESAMAAVMRNRGAFVCVLHTPAGTVGKATSCVIPVSDPAQAEPPGRVKPLPLHLGGSARLTSDYASVLGRGSPQGAQSSAQSPLGQDETSPGCLESDLLGLDTKKPSRDDDFFFRS